jgi:hypothetical protein
MKNVFKLLAQDEGFHIGYFAILRSKCECGATAMHADCKSCNDHGKRIVNTDRQLQPGCHIL